MDITSMPAVTITGRDDKLHRRGQATAPRNRARGATTMDLLLSAANAFDNISALQCTSQPIQIDAPSTQPGDNADVVDVDLWR